jgi:glycosyltransferase involved in cell wall biosynthesis
MKITVAIPFFNADASFTDSVSAVAQQTLPATEIIIVNANPTAETAAFLAQFNDKCRILTAERASSIAAARNIALAHAQGDWLAFSDAATCWEPAKLEKQQHYLESHAGFGACHTGIRLLAGEKTLAVYVDKPAVLTKQHLLVSGEVTASSLLVRKELLIAAGGYDDKFTACLDYDLTIRLVEQGCQIGFIAEPLISLRQNVEGASTVRWQATLAGHVALVKKHWGFFMGFGGVTATRRHLGTTIWSCGKKCGGVCGKLLAIAGSILAF